MIYYSKAVGGFFHSDIHTAIPTDAVQITEDQHQALLAAQASGKVITADGNGYPVATDRVTTVLEAQALLSRQAQNALDKSDVTVLRCLEHGVAIPAEWIAFRASLRDVIKGSSSVLPTMPAYPAGS